MAGMPRLWLLRTLCPGLLVLAAGAGCGGDPAEVPSYPAIGTTPAGGEEPSVPEEPRPENIDWLHQPFSMAVREHPPEDQRPPEKTMTGRSVGQLYLEVRRLWDTIRFSKPDGRRIRYTATVETDQGSFEIALDADRAPNHVRSFVALSKAGYYDGLVFDRVHHEETPLPGVSTFEEIEAGCPLGTGDPLANSIGYWLKPEISDDLKHVEGAVGACRGVEKDTAGCKFYVTLCYAPYLDGHYTIFGKVTSGLDVARKIYLRPVIIEDSDVNGSRRPLEPVVIRKVTIRTQ